MRQIKIIFVLFFILTISCSDSSKLGNYESILGIDFPNDLELIFSETHSELQDYSVVSIYKLTFNQKNELTDTIIDNLCDLPEEENCRKWKKCNNYYIYDYNDKEKGLSISVHFIAENDISLLTINEVKL